MVLLLLHAHLAPNIYFNFLFVENWSVSQTVSFCQTYKKFNIKFSTAYSEVIKSDVFRHSFYTQIRSEVSILINFFNMFFIISIRFQIVYLSFTTESFFFKNSILLLFLITEIGSQNY